jgi:hypothetical protein
MLRHALAPVMAANKEPASIIASAQYRENRPVGGSELGSLDLGRNTSSW